MMRRILFSPCRPSSHFRSFPQSRSSLRLLSISQPTCQLHPGELIPGGEKIAFTTDQTLELVRTRAITLQNAVENMTSLAKNKSEDERGIICSYLWERSFEAARISADSAVTIADFLSQLSYQSQEDHDDWLKGSVPSPIMIKSVYGHEERLWHDMPGMWNELDTLRTIEDPPDSGLDRKARIDRLLKDRHFISTLFRSTSPVFKPLSKELFFAFQLAAEWPPMSAYQRKNWDIWIPAIVVQMNAAGAELKDLVVSARPCDSDWPALGWWLRWQRRLLAMATDETIDAELRVKAKEAHDLMTIEKNLTIDWWRQWQHVLLEIATNEEEDKDQRVTAKRTNDILALEAAKLRRRK